MHIVAYVILLGSLILFGVAQVRYGDAYIARFGGPTRDELGWIYFRNFRRYVSALRRAPFSFSSALRPVSDLLVDRRRKQYVASLVGIPVGWVVGFLLLVLDPVPPPDWAVLFLVVTVGAAWVGLMLRWLWRSLHAQ